MIVFRNTSYLFYEILWLYFVAILKLVIPQKPLDSYPEISIWITNRINKIWEIYQGKSVQCKFFISDLNKPSDGKFFCQDGSVLQTWAASKTVVAVL